MRDWAALARRSADEAGCTPVCTPPTTATEECDVFQGVVKRYFSERGFGFIREDGGNTDIFFHVQGLANRDVEPQVGDTVTYDVEPDSRSGRLRATNVKII
jgi:cold shock CspA family protein